MEPFSLGEGAIGSVAPAMKKIIGQTANRQIEQQQQGGNGSPLHAVRMLSE